MASQNATSADDRLLEMLEARIVNGHYSSGSRIPTERCLSAELRVGRAAVRLALRRLEERGLIVRSPGCRAWISDRVDRRPDMSRSHPSGPGLRVVAAILPQHPVYPAALSILRGINAVLKEDAAPSRLLVFDTNSPASIETQERNALDAALHDRVSGVILWHHCGEATLPGVLRLRDAGIPVIFVDRCPNNLDCDFVGVDNRDAAREAVEHLITLGHRRIAHITEEPAVEPVAERAQGYRDALHAAGITPREQMIIPLRSPTAGELNPALHDLYRLDEPPTAIFAVNDAFAHAIITQLESQGRHSPRDVSVVGFDDLERYSPRPALLTTMHQPFERIGKHAAKLLIRRVVSERPAVSYQHVLLPTSLIVRATSGAPRDQGRQLQESVRAEALSRSG